MMRKYIILLVGTVFLGSQLLAIPTPLAQITPYRLLVVGLLAILLYQLYKGDPNLQIVPNNNATIIVSIFLFWWCWGAISAVWTLSFINWFHAMFLLTLGVSSIIGLYLWVSDFVLWANIIRTMWVMMSLLALWGLYEILTNNYIFADLTLLDKNQTFASQPSTRIPITTFANQNDYATLLLASLPVNIIMFNLDRHSLRRYLYFLPILLTSFLIYRSDSRMILFSIALFSIFIFLLQFRFDFKAKQIYIGLFSFIALVVAVLVFVPSIRETISQLYYVAGDFFNTGDSRRMNLWRNGLIFLAETYGLGLGAGNIEVWMDRMAFLSVDEFTNIHNWWLEILVGYGVIVFILYVIAYILMFKSLNKLRYHDSDVIRQIAISFMAFLIVYIFASITSANNMLIEWHWVFFGVIISFIKIMESGYTLNSRIERNNYEFSDNNK
ncbi:O-antigen ligase family protein [Aerococcaceae bacterium WGS1372]